MAIVFNSNTNMYERSFSYGDGLKEIPEGELKYILNSMAALARDWEKDKPGSFHAKQIQTILNQVK